MRFRLLDRLTRVLRGGTDSDDGPRPHRASAFQAEGSLQGAGSHAGPASLDFQECDTCRAKPGSPTLCRGCLHNRAVISEFRKMIFYPVE